MLVRKVRRVRLHSGWFFIMQKLRTAGNVGKIGNDVKFPLAPMGVSLPGSAHAGPSARTPIGTSGNFPAHVSAE